MMSDDPLHEIRKPLFSRLDPDVSEKYVDVTQLSEHNSEDEGKKYKKITKWSRLKVIKERI
jgi:hypothetical protein